MDKSKCLHCGEGEAFYCEKCYQDLIGENGKKYPLIVDSFNYFVGFAENAISYYNNIDNLSNYRYYISHKVIRFDDTIQVIYNPLNIIFDYKVRDIAEYVKNSFGYVTLSICFIFSISS